MDQRGLGLPRCLRTKLEISGPIQHIHGMTIKSSKTRNSENGKDAVRVLGRSAATGHLVLLPASKAGSISIRAANAAVKSVNSKKK
jgi:hypothetical protein